MRLRSKVITNISVIVLAGLVVLAVTLGSIAVNITSTATSEQVHQRLIGLRDAKKDQIESYFSFIESQVVSFAANMTVVEAAIEFSDAFGDFQSEANLPGDSERLRSLDGFYKGEFLPKYENQNGANGISSSGLLSGLSDNAKALQYAYISSNSHALGEKDKMLYSSDGSVYSALHGDYHPMFQTYLSEFGYYDIFLVDITSGDVIYSVYKELDFATSLTSGPYQNSGIARVFAKAKNLGKGEVAIDDFEPYTPSYEAPASFIATPVFSEGRAIAVLIFQMPIDRINAVMTYEGQWQARGLGDSGETYIVGADNRLRSQSRFLLEDKAAYLDALRSGGESDSIVRRIDVKNTSIGLQSVNSESARKALQGESGFSIVTDYRGVSVASAYAR